MYPDAYLKDPTNLYWEGYSGQKTIVWDDITPGTCLTTEMYNRLGNVIPVLLNVKGSSV